MTIVKVQRPLIGSVPSDHPPILVYDEARQHLCHLQLRHLPDWLAEALEAQPKVFAEARWLSGEWRFERRAGWQGW